MKKLFALLMALCLCASLAACAQKSPEAPAQSETPIEESVQSEEEEVSLRLAGLKGPTTMGMVKLIADADETLSYTLAGSADEITPLLIKGELDLAAVPANLASVLYNKTEGAVRVLAVNTLGVLYIADTTGEVSSVSDLAGKTVFATGKGSTPEYALRHILEANGIDPDGDVNIEFKSEPSEVVALLAQQGGIAMLPQPFATAALKKVEGLSVALDLTAEWDALGENSSLITGVLVGRGEFIDAHPAFVASFLEKYAESAAFTNENPADAAVLIGEAGIVDAAIAEKAIPACNIVCITGEDMKTALSGYLGVLYEQNPAAVGGALPGDDFYAVG